MTRWQLSACALAVVAAVTTGCSDSDADSSATATSSSASSSESPSTSSSSTRSSTADSSAADASPVCGAASDLQGSVDQLTQVQVTQDGLGALRTALSAVGADVGQLVDAGSDRIRPEVEGLQTDLTAIGDALDAATADPSVAALRTVGSTISTLVDDVRRLPEELDGSC